MDFFHCNACFARPGPPNNQKFCLTSCGHTFCTECLSLGSSLCKECQSVCKVLLLTKDKNHYVSTKNSYEKKSSDVEVLKQKKEQLMLENEHLKREIVSLKQSRKIYPEYHTPVQNTREMFLNESKKFGSRAKSVDNSRYVFKPSNSKQQFGLYAPSSNDSLLSQNQRLTPMASIMKNMSALRENMRILKPSSTPNNVCVMQPFAMTSKERDGGSPDSYCSSISSIRSPFMLGKKPYHHKP